LVRYYADLIRTGAPPDRRPGLNGTATLVVKEPVGTVAAITPWNYPQTLAMMKIAPALAAGCSIVLKPAPETSLDAFVFAEAAMEADLPGGVINVLPGDRDVGSVLVSHPGVDKVAFTGSSAAGRSIGETCGRLLRPATLELGGKSAAILLDDVPIDLFTSKLVRVSLPHGGQTCHSTTRILAPRSRYGEMVEAITEAAKAIRVGDPLDDLTEMGPMVSAAHRERVLSYIELGKSSGARLTTGGGVPKDLDRGWFVEPTIFADVDNSSRIAQEEIFGPVLCVIPYSDEADALRIANDSDFGLGGSVWTADEDRGVGIAHGVHTGSCGVNHYGLDPAAPFGGVKASGIGRELGPEGLQAYLTTKSIYLPPRTTPVPVESVVT
jgi:aldehyde dehydrogenase (NAD+)